MIVLRESRYRVFGNTVFTGNPITLLHVDTLDDDEALRREAERSRTEDNVCYAIAAGQQLLVRFFSSHGELMLCGHGLLALAHHLHARLGEGVHEVQSPHGTWKILNDARGPAVIMPVFTGMEIVDELHWMKRALASLDIAHRHLYLCPNGVWVVHMHDPADLLTLDADHIAALPTEQATPGAIIAVVPLREARYGFRYFAPWHGKSEDCGTGSAHCYLAPLMLEASAQGTALQFSPRGIGEMRVALRQDGVWLSGRVDTMQ